MNIVPAILIDDIRLARKQPDDMSFAGIIWIRTDVYNHQVKGSTFVECRHQVLANLDEDELIYKNTNEVHRGYFLTERQLREVTVQKGCDRCFEREETCYYSIDYV